MRFFADPPSHRLVFNETSRQELQSHKEQMHTESVCALCGASVPTFALPAHTEKECPKRNVPCCFCNSMVSADRKEAHEAECGSVYVIWIHRCVLDGALSMICWSQNEGVREVSALVPQPRLRSTRLPARLLQVRQKRSGRTAGGTYEVHLSSADSGVPVL